MSEGGALAPDPALEALVSGTVSFLGLPHQTRPAPASGVVLGVPFDGGVIHRPGARLGPWALRQASLGLGRRPMPLRLQGQDEGGGGWAAGDWVDGGNLPTRPFGLLEALATVEEGVSAWLQAGARTLLLGGDHLMTLGALRAHARRHGPLGLLHLDAHPDAACGARWGSPLHHGTWLRQAFEEGLLDRGRVVVAGLRAPRMDSEELAFLSECGARLWTPWDLADPRLASQLAGDLLRVGQGPAYVSLDLDVLDPACCPAVAEPVPAGLAPRELVALLRQVHRWEHPWTGADLMELAPTLPGTEDSARLAVHLALHLLA